MAILVTGGTKGIGRAIALRFAKPGADVFLNYQSDLVAAERTRDAVASLGAIPHLVQGDAGTPSGVAKIMDCVRSQTDRLDQIVHCAVKVVPGRALDADPLAFTNALNLNGTAVLYLVKESMDLLRRGSTVFFLSSRGGRAVLPNYASVGVGKALAESLIRYIAFELAPLGIRANCVAPSAMDTAALRSAFGEHSQKIMDDAANGPSGRAISDDDITSLVEFLASPAAEMIQGQVIFVNGGHNITA